MGVRLLSLALAAAGCTECEGSATDISPDCRGDEVCVDGSCCPWQKAPLWADFSFTDESPQPLGVVVRVEGGFPPRFVESIRTDFGDHRAGHGSTVEHIYEAPGRYPVTLEVRLQGGRLLTASRPVAVGADPGPRLTLTVNGVPESHNGSRPHVRAGREERYHLLLPTFGFTVDLSWIDGADPLAIETLAVVAGTPVGGRGPGENLADWLSPQGHARERLPRRRWHVNASQAFSAGMHTLALDVRTVGGTRHTASLSFETTPLTAAIDPFADEFSWLLRSDTDFFTIASEALDDGYVSLEALPGANGEPDFLEELTAIGARGQDAEANIRFLGWVLDAVRRHVLRIYGDEAARFEVWHTLMVGAPRPEDYDPDGSFSMIRLGGVVGDLLGRSQVAPHNAGRVDDTDLDHGVSTTRVLAGLLGAPGISEQFVDVHPLLGRPVGSHSSDLTVLRPDYDRYGDGDVRHGARFDALARIADRLGLAIATVTAHEMGHGMGLMPEGPPPRGFFGNVTDSDAVGGKRSTGFHADFPGINLMQAGGDLAMAIADALEAVDVPHGATLADIALALAFETRLSPYAKAYIRGRQTYRPE